MNTEARIRQLAGDAVVTSALMAQFTDYMHDRAEQLADVVAAARLACDKSNCRCGPEYLGRDRHASDCFWDYVDGYGVTDALAALDGVEE